MKFLLTFLTFDFLLSSCALAQTTGLISGPWAGNIELRNATIWAEVSPSIKKVSVQYSVVGSAFARTVHYDGEPRRNFNTIKIELNGLEINTKYTYKILLDGKPATLPYSTSFKTKELWEYRTPAPDFNFLAGSCSFFNEPVYDRPGKGYGKDSSIFNVMAETPAAMNIWLGDSWYNREVDYSTAWGMAYRVSRDRSMKVVQKFMSSMPHYFIWDDHDFGPNDAGKSFILKKESREVFKNYTLNPTYGEDGKGIYTKVSYSDVDFFLTDDRYFRSERRMADSVDGRPNAAKTYFGPMQMDWLKNALLFSNATFKIIASGSQILNPVSTAESLQNYSSEYNELIHFITQHKIRGIIFLTGDRHHSEVMKLDRPSTYTLYDITVSPLTASVGTLRGAEINNPTRIANTLVEAQNFGNISVTGPKDNRRLKVEFIGLKGDKLAEWQVSASDLK